MSLQNSREAAADSRRGGGRKGCFLPKQAEASCDERSATVGGDGDSSGRGKRSRAVRGHAPSPRTRACSLKPSQKEAASTCCFWGVEGGAPHVSWGPPGRLSPLLPHIFLRMGRLPPGMFWETETLRDHLRLHPPRFSVRELTSPRF